MRSFLAWVLAGPVLMGGCLSTGELTYGDAHWRDVGTFEHGGIWLERFEVPHDVGAMTVNLRYATEGDVLFRLQGPQGEYGADLFANEFTQDRLEPWARIPRPASGSWSFWMEGESAFEYVVGAYVGNETAP